MKNFKKITMPYTLHAVWRNWEFKENGFPKKRYTSSNDLPIDEKVCKIYK